MISCLAACPSSRPVLTAYPPAYTLLKEGSTSESKLAREAAAAAVARPIGHAVVASNEVSKGIPIKGASALIKRRKKYEV